MTHQSQEKYTSMFKRKMSQDAIYWVNLEKHRRKDHSSGRPDLMPSSFMTPCQLTALKKMVSTIDDNILYPTIPTTRPVPKIVLQNAWQAQHDKPTSEQSWSEGNLFKVYPRVQGVSQNAVLEDQGRVTKIQDLVHTLRTESRTESVIADFSET